MQPKSPHQQFTQSQPRTDLQLTDSTSCAALDRQGPTPRWRVAISMQSPTGHHSGEVGQKPVGAPSALVNCSLQAIPGHALHGKSVGPMVSSQERRAAAVPPINQLSNGYRVPPFGLYRLLFFVPPKRRPGRLSSAHWRSRPGPTAAPRRPAPPCPIPPRRASPVGCSGFGFDN